MATLDLERTADIAAALHAVPRRSFLPAENRALAHEDRPLPIGHGQTNSQPSTVVAMLRLLQIPVGAKVLDVGSGSGWTTALLATLVGPTGRVIGVERHPELVAWGAANLDNWLESQPADQVAPATIVRALPGMIGLPVSGGYDRILVSATSKSLPQALLDQMAHRSRMVLPVGETLTLVERDHEVLRVTDHGSYAFVPLIP